MDAPVAEEGGHRGREEDKWGVCPHRLLEPRQWDALAMGGDGGGERASWPEEGRLGRLSMAGKGAPGSRGTAGRGTMTGREEKGGQPPDGGHGRCSQERGPY
ncbi:unnamed protein product [Miscanthus lutarioriparius]|uniref:Uncharacterized protein n=1 Tax=Miscanthus lutarioriparius TaxID=422564 RepID=A0A811NBZ4_9POAL|nr:unnamed protein product [Miscanthus lutarioriparius]